MRRRIGSISSLLWQWEPNLQLSAAARPGRQMTLATQFRRALAHGGKPHARVEVVWQADAIVAHLQAERPVVHKAQTNDALLSLRMALHVGQRFQDDPIRRHL